MFFKQDGRKNKDDLPFISNDYTTNISTDFSKVGITWSHGRLNDGFDRSHWESSPGNQEDSRSAQLVVIDCETHFDETNTTVCVGTGVNWCLIMARCFWDSWWWADMLCVYDKIDQLIHAEAWAQHFCRMCAHAIAWTGNMTAQNDPNKKQAVRQNQHTTNSKSMSRWSQLFGRWCRPKFVGPWPKVERAGKPHKIPGRLWRFGFVGYLLDFEGFRNSCVRGASHALGSWTHCKAWAGCVSDSL